MDAKRKIAICETKSHNRFDQPSVLEKNPNYLLIHDSILMVFGFRRNSPLFLESWTMSKHRLKDGHGREVRFSYQNITKALHDPTSYKKQCAARGVSRM
jgi:hypothetical protein